MTKFKVEVTFHGSEMVEIDTDSAADAERIANEMIIDRDLLAEDLESTQWIVGGAQVAEQPVKDGA